jgi:hypothetical protein
VMVAYSTSGYPHEQGQRSILDAVGSHPQTSKIDSSGALVHCTWYCSTTRRHHRRRKLYCTLGIQYWSTTFVGTTST